MPNLFVDDQVALKADPSILGQVDQTWRDLDEGRPFFHLSQLILHGGLTKRKASRIVRDGRLPPNHVLLRFIEPYSGYSIVLESDLILIDRSFAVGDVVKRGPSEAESGTVVRRTTQCDLKPLYAGINDTESWPHDAEGNELHHIPEEELKLTDDYAVGEYVVYQGQWIGVVSDVFESVVIRLSNGSIVRVQEADDLEVADHLPAKAAMSDTNCSLLSALRSNLERANNATGRGDTEPVAVFRLGQAVFTKKANLRLGKWIYGAYDPAIEPRGTIVDIQLYQINVDWITTNVFDMTGYASSEQPSTELVSDDFADVKNYNRNCSSTTNGQFGTRHWEDLHSGDYVRFLDVAGAAVKYTGQNSLKHGQFNRILRTSTQGYDMNVFHVKKTKTTVFVQWQDATTAEHLATDLIPYLNVDDHDVWVGEIVAMKGDDFDSTGRFSVDQASTLVCPQKIGVVQSTDARERIARVRWFKNSAVGMFDEQQSVLLPGSDLGELTNVETEVSVYDIVTYLALTKRRGDLVLVAPNPSLIAVHSTQALLLASNGPVLPPIRLPIPSDVMLHEDPDGLLASDNSGPTWFGEVVDLGLDGLMTVRLGGLDKVRDIRLGLERIVTVIGGDDDSIMGDSDEDDRKEGEDWDDAMSISEDNSQSEIVIGRTIEYEGGERLDADGGEEMWTTDDEGNDDQTSRQESVSVPKHHRPQSEDVNGSSDAIITSNLPSAPLSYSKLENHEDLHFATYNNPPTQFAILEEPAPYNHHFVTETVRLSGNLLRRIRKEHAILESSLPEGVWVRTWADRLDLLRILIIGARHTPYELAPFVMDFHFKDDFPTSPPEAYFHSWTNGVGRINPNLYEDGKCCLSLLGTWDSDNGRNEGWSTKSSMLQVIVSLMGLVLVREPYYNEAGFEALIGTPESRVSSAQYSEKALVMSKGFVKHALSNNITAFDDVLTWLYLAADGPRLLKRVVDESKALLGTDGTQGAPFAGTNARLSAGALILLRRHVEWLQNRLKGLGQHWDDDVEMLPESAERLD